MKCRIALHLLLVAIALVGAPTLAATTAPTTVTVSYDHPEQFTEARKVRAFALQLADDGYLKTLKAYMVDRASKILAPGERLDIMVTDIDRAGNFEPWRGPRMQSVRIVKDTYPPRMSLRFRLYDASGKLIREGARKLVDPGFLTGDATANQNDNLRFEKRLIDRWLRKGPANL